MGTVNIRTDFGRAFGIIDSGEMESLTDYLCELHFNDDQIAEIQLRLHEVVLGRPFAILMEIEVEPELQGRGHGKILLRSFLAQTKASGAKLVFLVCDLDRSQRPKFKLSDFYRKNGFVELDDLFFELGVMVYTGI